MSLVGSNRIGCPPAPAVWPPTGRLDGSPYRRGPREARGESASRPVPCFLPFHVRSGVCESSGRRIESHRYFKKISAGSAASWMEDGDTVLRIFCAASGAPLARPGGRPRSRADVVACCFDPFVVQRHATTRRDAYLPSSSTLWKGGGIRCTGSSF